MSHDAVLARGIHALQNQQDAALIAFGAVGVEALLQACQGRPGLGQFGKRLGFATRRQRLRRGVIAQQVDRSVRDAQCVAQ